MSGFLLDTNCISELFRIKPDSNVTAWTEDAEKSLLYLSVLTLGEISRGLASLSQGKRRSQLETWLEVELRARFSGRILPIDSAVADRWGLLTANAKAKGKPISTIDALPAATAIQHDLTHVSQNAGDFVACTRSSAQSVETIMTQHGADETAVKCYPCPRYVV